MPKGSRCCNKTIKQQSTAATAEEEVESKNELFLSVAAKEQRNRGSTSGSR